MARNRKYYSAANRFGPALKAFLLCLIIGGSGVGYVWQKDQISRLGEEIKKRERRLKTLNEVNENLKQLLAERRSPASLRRSIKEMNLGMGPPEPSQVWRLVEPPREAPKQPVREGQYVVQDGQGPVLP